MQVLENSYICVSEGLELWVKGGQVSHSWCMCVAGLGYGGFDVGRDGGWYACMTKPGGLVACRQMPEHFLCVR